MQFLNKPIYRVGEIEIDPARNCLRRHDEEWTLRQKSFQVLLYLLEHRERSVSKEELIKNIWDNVAITDDALVQIIVELRKMFGDDSRRPQFIRTIPKIGYHFIGPVSEHRCDPAQLIEIEEITTIQVEYERTTDVAPLSDRSSRSRLTAGQGWLQRTLPLARRRVTVFVGLSLLVVLMASWFVLRRTPEQALPALSVARNPGKKPVAVMYFENRASDRELDWLREGLADMLIASLSRSQRLTLLSRQQLTALLNHLGQPNATSIKLEDALEIARRAQAETMILGGFARLGDKVRLDVTLHDARTGQLQAAESLIADSPEQILTQIDLLSLKLATHLGAALADADAHHGLAAVMTNNLDAYRYYSLALEQTQMFQFHDAIAQFEKALALDPQFAMAHARVGYVYAVRLGQSEKARPFLEKALTLADRLNEKDKLFIQAWQATAERDPVRAIEKYRDLIARYPMETEAYQRLSVLLQGQDRNEEALTVTQQGLVTDPEWKDLYNQLGGVYLRLGRNKEALAANQRYIQLAPNDPNARDSQGLIHQWLGQYDEAEATYNRALALNPESSVAIIHLGNLQFQRGRYHAAAEQYRRYIQIARDDKQRARGFGYLAWLFWQRGDMAQAAAAANEAIRYDPTAGWVSLVLALQQRDSAATAKWSEVVFAPANQAIYSERGFLRMWEYQRGFVALRQGRGEEAIQRFRAALQHRAVEWHIDSFEDCLAKALLELGRNDEAISEYGRILKINPNYPLAHYHLGQAYERKGDPIKARAAYEQFLQVWRTADADGPEILATQRLLARL